MALLAYMMMVAMLITSVFVGYEWVVTSSGPRMFAEGHSTTKSTTRSKVATASDKPTGAPVASIKDHIVLVRDHRSTAQRRHARVVAHQQAIAREMAARNAVTKGVDVAAGNGKVATSEAALGFADAPQAPPPGNNGRLF